MKKILKTAAAALAGMLAIGFAACTEGNDEYNPEEPTTYCEAGKDYVGSGIAAKWDFTGLTDSAGAADAVWGLGNTETAFPPTGIDETTKGIKLADGNVPADAVLVPSGAWKKNKEVLQSKANSASLEKYNEAGGILKLTLKKQANIVVKGKGAGSAESRRFIIITDASGKKLAFKASLRNSKDEEFVVKGAPAGEYTIYINGASIYSIDLSANSTTLKKPVQITELKLYQGDAEASSAPSFAVYDTVKFAIHNVVGAEKGSDLAADALWNSSNENVATVEKGVVTGTGEGTAIIRARIGRFYDERTVTVTKNTKTSLRSSAETSCR